MSIVLTLHPQCRIEWAGVSRAGHRTALSDSALIAALKAGVDLDDIDHLTTTVAGHTTRTVLEVLQQRRLLQWCLTDDQGALIAAASPVVAEAAWPEFTADRGGSLSRFAQVRRRAGSWVMESGASSWEVELEPAALTLLGREDPALTDFLAAFGLLDDRDESPSLVCWEPADLAVATRTSLDFDPEHVGGTFRFRGSLEPTSFDQTTRFTGDIVSLPAASELPAVSMAEVIDRRRSVRDFRDEPISVETLSALLWHTVRATRLFPRDTDVADSYDCVTRPTPSSGGAAAIDVWVMARDVSGLATGTWWYNPTNHQLHRTSAHIASQGLPLDPQVTLVLAARHERLAWKYERLAYALALRDTGVVIHAVQLAATALGLGACPIGAAPHGQLAELMATTQCEHMPTGLLWVGVPDGEERA